MKNEIGEALPPDCKGHAAHELKSNSSLQSLMQSKNIEINYELLGGTKWWDEYTTMTTNNETMERAKVFRTWLATQPNKMFSIVAHNCISRYFWDMEAAKKTDGFCNHFPQNAPGAYILIAVSDKLWIWKRCLKKLSDITDELECLTENSKLILYIRHGESTANAEKKAEKKAEKEKRKLAQC